MCPNGVVHIFIKGLKQQRYQPCLVSYYSRYFLLSFLRAYFPAKLLGYLGALLAMVSAGVGSANRGSAPVVRDLPAEPYVRAIV